MSDENTSEVRATSETVTLSDLASQKIDRWLEQVAGKRVQLFRKEFLNWFIEKSPDNLSNADLNAIVDKYYDEEKFLRRLLREMKKAKQDGQSGNIEVIVRQKKSEAKRSTEPENEAEMQFTEKNES